MLWTYEGSLSTKEDVLDKGHDQRTLGQARHEMEYDLFDELRHPCRLCDLTLVLEERLEEPVLAGVDG